MTKLPRDISPLECIKALEKAGFTQRRQAGSHVTMVRDDPYGFTVVPLHNKKLKTGMLRAIVRQAGLTVEEFTLLL